MGVKPSRGVVHGKSIELLEDLGLIDGQEVFVTVRVLRPRPVWGQGILNSAGGMAPHWTSEDDRILDEIELDRRQPTTREIPE